MAIFQISEKEKYVITDNIIIADEATICQGYNVFLNQH